MSMIQDPGTYDVTVKSLSLGQTPNTGSAYIELEFETEDGQTAYRSLFLTEKAFEYTDRRLKEVFDFDGGYDPESHLKEQIVGKSCRIVMDNETGDDGKERLVVRWINKQREVKELDGGADFLKKLTAKSARLGGSTYEPKAFPGETKKDEEVPF